MKNKLFIPGLLISLALLTFSCTNDDYEISADQNNQIKTLTKDSLKNLNEKMNAKIQDSINKNTIQAENITEGDPIIPRPPRKD
ncbi:hypothetical protein [uncultured Flavobacterium sp.]|uniref:hypothetical protein n=1 Tax=uncultured Flavobacterium sp. TaxID=165435 RepID=UPI0030819C4A